MTTQTFERDLARNYLVTEIIGKGSFGEVCKAVHRKTRKCVALKKIAKAASNLGAHLREVKMMKKCSQPDNNLVEFFGSEIVGNDLWIIMELCELGSSFDILRLTGSALTELQVATICRSTLQALIWTAANNIAHRDIKPHNIFLNAQGAIKIGDLGIARELDANGCATDLIGSLLYLAPEVARQAPYTSKVDVWSLGVTAMELIQGYAPRHTLTSDELLRELVYSNEPPKLKNPNRHSAPFRDFLRLALTIDPAQRPTAAQLFEHPFIAAASESNLQELADEVAEIVAMSGSYEEALEGALLARSSSFGSLSFGSSQSSISSGNNQSKLEDEPEDKAPQPAPAAPQVQVSLAPPKLIRIPTTEKLSPKGQRIHNNMVPPFARPLFRMPSKGKGSMNNVFLVDAPALVSPRQLEAEVSHLQPFPSS